MPGSAAKILITERQQKVLQDIARSRTAPLHLTQRAPIILRAFERIDNQDIAAEIDLNRNSVGVWRRRWAEAWERLTIIECTGTQADLRRAIEDVLSDEPRRAIPANSRPSRSPRSWHWPANRPRNRDGPSRTGPVMSWPTKPRSGASWSRSRQRRSVAT